MSKINRHITVNIFFISTLIALITGCIFDFMKNENPFYLFGDGLLLGFVSVALFFESKDLYHLIRIKLELRKIKNEM